MAEFISLILSGLALVISATTAWITLFQRGTIKMTQPTVFFFGPDSRPSGALPKIFLRTLLFSTSKRGRVIESMYVEVFRNESHQSFNIWVYGDDKLVRGSGLFVGEEGVAANHHFLAPDNATTFRFLEGKYRIKVFAYLYGDRKKKLLFSQELDVSRDIAIQLTDPDTGLYFDWGPDSSRYLSHIDKKERGSGPDGLL